MRRLLFIVLALLVAAPLIIVRSGSEPSAAEEQHCLATVIAQADDGELILSEPVCTTGSVDELYAAHGVGEFTGEGELAAGARYGIIARHYDGSWWSGSSFSVSGANCGGGHLNLSSSWKNRINSTYAPTCTRVKHFDYPNTSGSYQSTWPSGTLSYMINRADSVQYL